MGLLPSQASAAPSAPASFQLKNITGNKCLEIENSGTHNGARAQQWACVNQPGSYWSLRDAGQGYVYVVNRHSGKCLEIENSWTFNGAPAQQWDCKGQLGSKWYIWYDKYNWRLHNAASGKVLEIENSSNSNGARAQLWADAYQRGSYWWKP